MPSLPRPEPCPLCLGCTVPVSDGGALRFCGFCRGVGSVLAVACPDCESGTIEGTSVLGRAISVPCETCGARGWTRVCGGCGRPQPDAPAGMDGESNHAGDCAWFLSEPAEPPASCPCCGREVGAPHAESCPGYIDGNAVTPKEAA